MVGRVMVRTTVLGLASVRSSTTTAAAADVPRPAPASTRRTMNVCSAGGATHMPAPSQWVPPLAVQAVDIPANVDVGDPLLQPSTVQTLPSSAGLSASRLAGTSLPLPSHWFCLQSCSTWSGVGVPAAMAVLPQALFVHWNIRQDVSVPQSLFIVQPIHWPLPSQCWLVPQVVVSGSDGCDGVPLVQTSLVHGLPSTGRSVSSLTCMVLPWPSHWAFLQSRGDCAVSDSTVPEAA